MGTSTILLLFTFTVAALVPHETTVPSLVGTESATDSTSDHDETKDDQLEPAGEKGDEEIETFAERCYGEFEECWNETNLKNVTDTFSMGQFFEARQITQSNIGLFCMATAPLIAKCMAINLQTQATSANETGRVLERCAVENEKEKKLEANEIEEIGNFYRSYHYLCQPSVLHTGCLELKKRACVLERQEKACKEPCEIPFAEKDDPENTAHKYRSRGHVLLIAYCLSAVIGTVVLSAA